MNHPKTLCSRKTNVVNKTNLIILDNSIEIKNRKKGFYFSIYLKIKLSY